MDDCRLGLHDEDTGAHPVTCPRREGEAPQGEPGPEPFAPLPDPAFVHTDEYGDTLTVRRFPECWSFFVDPGDAEEDTETVAVKVPHDRAADLARVLAAATPTAPQGEPEADWHEDCDIITDYRRPYGPPDQRPLVVVRHRPSASFLRYSQGPRQGHFWDMYGEDYQTEALARLALSQAPPPPGTKGFVPEARLATPTAPQGEPGTDKPMDARASLRWVQEWCRGLRQADGWAKRALDKLGDVERTLTAATPPHGGAEPFPQPPAYPDGDLDAVTDDEQHDYAVLVMRWLVDAAALPEPDAARARWAVDYLSDAAPAPHGVDAGPPADPVTATPFADIEARRCHVEDIETSTGLRTRVIVPLGGVEHSLTRGDALWLYHDLGLAVAESMGPKLPKEPEPASPLPKSGPSCDRCGEDGHALAECSAAAIDPPGPASGGPTEPVDKSEAKRCEQCGDMTSVRNPSGEARCFAHGGTGVPKRGTPAPGGPST